MTTYEVHTELTPAEVLRRAREFFALAASPYAAFPDRVGENAAWLKLEVGEVVIGALSNGGSTHVRGSASRGAHLLTRFLATLGPAGTVWQKTHRRGTGW